jgi:hypothetical protein
VIAETCAFSAAANLDSHGYWVIPRCGDLCCIAGEAPLALHQTYAIPVSDRSQRRPRDPRRDVLVACLGLDQELRLADVAISAQGKRQIDVQHIPKPGAGCCRISWRTQIAELAWIAITDYAVCPGTADVADDRSTKAWAHVIPFFAARCLSRRLPRRAIPAIVRPQFDGIFSQRFSAATVAECKQQSVVHTVTAAACSALAARVEAYSSPL